MSRDPLGSALAVLWVAGHIAAAVILGAIVHEQMVASPGTSAAGTDTSLTLTDPTPVPGDA
ncbi:MULTISPECIES: hypothetical protein [Streptomyces]|uniref:Uncharacterized protein n=1 Tax=Streptomyces gibsoniae TaxID=3075529 RepID=A0ABU2TVX8_9ACTN|nr:hypothetical protein [Streptomyces sp. DSM 41699]MDT0465128.1 hypothetical protein [Streptomyces sp. DSM 41699]